MSAVAALLLSLMGTDRLGDPTPPGVMARYGTNRLCVGPWNEGELRFRPSHDELYLCPIGFLKYPDKAEQSSFKGFIARGWDCDSGLERFRFRYRTHTEALGDIQFDDSGRYRLMTQRNRSEVWDDKAGQLISTIPHPSPDDALSTASVFGFSSATRVLIASVNPDDISSRIVRVHRSSSGKMTRCELLTRAGTVTVLPGDGSRVWLAAGNESEIRSFSSDTGTLRSWRRAPIQDDVDPEPITIASSDGRRLFTLQLRIDARADRYQGYPECFIKVFDTSSNRFEARYTFRLDVASEDERQNGVDRNANAFVDFTLSNDGTFLAWTELDRGRYIRHLPTGRVVKIREHGDSFCSMVFSSNGKRLAVCGHDGVIRLIDPYTGRLQTTADNPATAARVAAISPDGRLVATGHACGEVWVWDAATGKPLWHTEPDGDPVRELHFNPTGTTVSAVGFWGPAGVRTWSANSGRELGPMLPYRYFCTLAVSADGKRIADLIEEKSVMEKGEWAYPLFVRTREVATGKEVNHVRLDHRLGLSNETNAVVSRNGRVMVVTHTNGDTIAYDTATGNRFCQLNSSRGVLAVSPDGRFALSCSDGKDTQRGGHIWDTLTGSKIALIEAPLLEHGVLAFSPCGRFLLSRGIFPALPVTWVFDLRSRHPTIFRGQDIVDVFPDGKSVLTLPGIRGAERVSLEPLMWKVAPPPKPSEARLEQLWTQLGEPVALDAVFELARHPDAAVPYLKAKLLTEPPDAKAVARHIEQLGSKLYADREESTKALRAFGPAVLPALRAALKDRPLPEVRRRLEGLLAALGDTTTPLTLARLRAVEVLERCGTPDSGKVLKTLAEKHPGTPWGDDAARALLRVAKE